MLWRSSLTQLSLIRRFLRPPREPSSMGERQPFLDDLLPPIGREGDGETISRLLQEKRIVTIHGIGGSGKTTLAKLVCDRAVGFDAKEWIRVSDGFKFGKVIKKILGGEGVTVTENELEAELRLRLRGRRFLVVLDDLWSNGEAQWKALVKLLMEISDQAKIIVTTREDSVVATVSELMDTVSSHTSSHYCHRLELLSDEDLLVLFNRYAFGEGIDEIPNDLSPIGEQIVSKCAGLPLAVKILAVTLSENRDAARWEITGGRNRVEFEPLLRLCRHLPVYCKDYFFNFLPLLQYQDIKYEDFLDLWMTDGLFESLDQEKSVTVVVKELKSIIEKKQKQRNFLRDLICHPTIISRLPENQRPVINVSLDEIEGEEKVVDISISCRNFGEDRNPALQTLFLWVFKRDSVSKLFSTKSVSKFKLLRMLVLKKILLELPCIDYMSRLKCLNLSWNHRMTKLPSFIFKMRNLEILRLEGCSHLLKLPKDIKKLSRLKVLSITAEKMDSPGGIEKLTSLQSLLIRDCKTRLPIGMYLTHLTALQSLTIYACPDLVFPEEGAASESLLELKLENLPNLKALPLRINCLRLLHINYCEKLDKLPDCSPDMLLERFVIENCRQLCSLPEGMPQLQRLRSLEICNCPDLKSYLEGIMEEVDQKKYFEDKLHIIR